MERGRLWVIKLMAMNGNKSEGEAIARLAISQEMATWLAIIHATKKWKVEEGWRVLIAGVEPLILGH